ncbi:guanosine monophosphate reductase, partial [bacterium]|nr:guanosine monophosphate reductase [bacterium]
MKMKKTICFDDVLLVPHHSKVKSRHDIDLTMSAGDLKLNMPIIAAPMDTVCEDQMALVMSIEGGLGIIHRYQPIEDQAKMVAKVASKGHIVFGSVGVKNTVNDAIKLVEAGARGILVDTANGHSELAIDSVRRLRYKFSSHIHIMA